MSVPGETEVGTQSGPCGQTQDVRSERSLFMQAYHWVARPFKCACISWLTRSFCCPTICCQEILIRQVRDPFQFAQKGCWVPSLEFSKSNIFLCQFLIDLYSASVVLMESFVAFSGGWSYHSMTRGDVKECDENMMSFIQKPSSHRFVLRLQVLFTDTVASGQLETLRQY